MRGRNDLIAIAAIVALFLCAVIAVNSRGEFPLDDDWDFSATTFILASTGHIQHAPFTVATAYLQEYWGAAWTLVFGPSFTVLRLSTLVLSLLATLLVYALLRRTRAAPGAAVLGTAAFLFHPLFFWASFTYMTHVPMVLVSVAALLAFAIAVERGGVWTVVAAVLIVLSFFTRQLGVINALAALASAVVMRRSIGPRWRTLAAAAAGTLLLFGVLFFATDTFVGSAAELQMHLGAQRSVHDLLIGPPHYAFFNLQNAALFFLPLLVLCARVRPQRSVTIVIGLVFIAIAIHLMAIGRLLPYFNGGNVFADLGLGPQTLRDVFTFRMAYPRHLGQPTRIVLMAVSTAAAIFLAAVVVAVAAGRFRFASARAELVARYGAIYCLAGTVLIAVMRIYFDRYSIDTLWPVAIVLPLLAATRPISRRRIAAAAVALTLVASFAIIETAEYLAWNRARWQAFAFLRANGVTLQQMDGGYEINAMLALQTGRKSLGKPGFAVVDDRYIIAFNQVPGYTTLRAFPFPRVLGLRTGYVYAEARK